MSNYETPDEIGIPPCVVEMRLDDYRNRARRNMHGHNPSEGYVYSSLPFSNAGDGRAIVKCLGNCATDCAGGEVLVDRHDLILPDMPEITSQLGKICTARQKLFRVGAVLRTYEDLD